MLIAGDLKHFPIEPDIMALSDFCQRYLLVSSVSGLKRLLQDYLFVAAFYCYLFFDIIYFELCGACDFFCWNGSTH